MASYKLAPAAQSDLIDIRRYTLDKWGAAQWALYFNELKSAMSLLAENPKMGRPVPDTDHNYCCFPLRHHIIYYIPQSDHIVIAAVLGKAMCPARHFNKQL